MCVQHAPRTLRGERQWEVATLQKANCRRVLFSTRHYTYMPCPLDKSGDGRGPHGYPMTMSVDRTETGANGTHAEKESLRTCRPCFSLTRLPCECVALEGIRRLLNPTWVVERRRLNGSSATNWTNSTVEWPLVTARATEGRKEVYQTRCRHV